MYRSRRLPRRRLLHPLSCRCPMHPSRRLSCRLVPVRWPSRRRWWRRSGLPRCQCPPPQRVRPAALATDRPLLRTQLWVRRRRARRNPKARGRGRARRSLRCLRYTPPWPCWRSERLEPTQSPSRSDVARVGRRTRVCSMRSRTMIGHSLASDS